MRSVAAPVFPISRLVIFSAAFLFSMRFSRLLFCLVSYFGGLQRISNLFMPPSHRYFGRSRGRKIILFVSSMCFNLDSFEIHSPSKVFPCTVEKYFRYGRFRCILFYRWIFLIEINVALISLILTQIFIITSRN